MSSTFEFTDQPDGPGMVPTDHEGFEEGPQWVDPSQPNPSLFGVAPPGYDPFGPEDGGPILDLDGQSEEMPEDSFDPAVEQDIVGLLFLGFLSRTCHVYGHSFVLKTLRGGEDLAISQIVDEQPGYTSQGKALMYAQVAAALVSIDGREFTHKPMNDSHEQVISTIRQRMKYLFDYHPAVVERLFKEYQELALRVDAAFQEYEGKLTAGRPSPQP